MKTRLFAYAAIVSFAVIFQVRSLAAAPTIDDARKDFAAGDYPTCLRKVSGLLASKPAKSAPDERFDLLMLRGECMLRVKQQRAAADAFDAAASVMKTRRDLPRAASATSLAVLVKASPDLTYKPKKQADTSGINIVEPSTRGAAMQALFEDLNAKAAPHIDKAMEDKSLAPTDKLLREVWELYTVEMAATGDVASTAAKLEALGGHARSLIVEELDRVVSRLEQLKDLASEPTWATAVMSYRGLNTTERNELRQMADYLTQIQRTVENGRRISRVLGRTGENWDVLLADCAVARDVAQEAYDRRY